MRYYPMNEFLDDLFDSRVFTNRNVMKTDIYEKDGRFYLEIEVPGVKKENLKVDLKEGYLKISATVNSGTEEKDSKGKLVRSERQIGSASRSFYVGDKLEPTDIHARYADGILIVDIPSKTPARVEENKVISID